MGKGWEMKRGLNTAVWRRDRGDDIDAKVEECYWCLREGGRRKGMKNVQMGSF